MQVLKLYALPRQFSEKNPELSIQVILSNLVTHAKQKDPENPFKIEYSYDVYSNGKTQLLTHLYQHVENPSEYKKETVVLPEGFLDERIITALMVTCPCMTISRVYYESKGESFSGVLPSTILTAFFEQVNNAFYSQRYVLPKITDELISAVSETFTRSDITLISDVSPSLLKQQVIQFLDKNKGKEFFVMIKGEDEDVRKDES